MATNTGGRTYDTSTLIRSTRAKDMGRHTDVPPVCLPITTGQLADTPTRGLDISRTGHLADWTTRGCHRRL